MAAHDLWFPNRCVRTLLFQPSSLDRLRIGRATQPPQLRVLRLL